MALTSLRIPLMDSGHVTLQLVLVLFESMISPVTCICNKDVTRLHWYNRMGVVMDTTNKNSILLTINKIAVYMYRWGYQWCHMFTFRTPSVVLYRGKQYTLSMTEHIQSFQNPTFKSLVVLMLWSYVPCGTCKHVW